MLCNRSRSRSPSPRYYEHQDDGLGAYEDSYDGAYEVFCSWFTAVFCLLAVMHWVGITVACSFHYPRFLVTVLMLQVSPAPSRTTVAVVASAAAVKAMQLLY
tara:strand:+ start:147 stop:452 length:306 start_codon:yes stop_codon:yes gene_type:complete